MRKLFLILCFPGKTLTCICCLPNEAEYEIADPLILRKHYSTTTSEENKFNSPFSLFFNTFLFITGSRTLGYSTYDKEKQSNIIYIYIIVTKNG